MSPRAAYTPPQNLSRQHESGWGHLGPSSAGHSGSHLWTFGYYSTRVLQRLWWSGGLELCGDSHTILAHSSWWLRLWITMIAALRLSMSCTWAAQATFHSGSLASCLSVLRNVASTVLLLLGKEAGSSSHGYLACQCGSGPWLSPLM